MMDPRVKKIMEKLQITEAEAMEVIAADEAIDAGEKLFELSAEQKKFAKAARTTTSAEAAPKKSGPRERKVDETKHSIFAALESALSACGAEGMEVTTADRQLDFVVDGRKFRVVLSAPRK